ncbi:meprin A subunit beta isoform X1 [Alosa sapidissima]|uniref:meprin A subunit beta isoform X1 n=1 Tax=Alosa sapidissima TaxID=34773 RepID=UPI001C08A325|nr:meprin A subunit beta isoform X1 [Alosa sapidissima]
MPANSVAIFLLLCLCGGTQSALPDETDMDGGRDLDIFDINSEAGLELVEGDIDMTEDKLKNSIIGEQYRWPMPVPYVLEDSLDINAKGVILKAFEEYRLKSCIDFKPWTDEENYIGVFKGSGCFSSVGNRREGKQRLSIGTNCDRLGTVEHEFLHALGFWHEQSRPDRDDYVNIVWDEITPGKEHNFNKYEDTVSSTLGVPYDYGSVMHYGKTAFNIAELPTIVTRIPAFLDVIGQRMGFSDSDLEKLNRLYNCTSSSTFLDLCGFEEANVCGMIQGADGKSAWKRVPKAVGGPQTDYTTMGRCEGAGYFMHFDGSAGDTAFLESRLLYPQRSSQCLQFYLYQSGASDDKLRVHIREFAEGDTKGTLRLIETISGGVKDSWELHHVTLNTNKKFRVVFEGVMGLGGSAGALSLDDINLSETECPHHTWRIRNFTHLLTTTATGVKIYSPRIVSRDGYSFQVGLYINGNSSPGNMAIYLHLTSGPHDDTLTWPCPWRQVTMALMDQNPDIRQRMTNYRMVTTDPTRSETNPDGSVEYYWDDPRKVGSLVSDTDGTQFYRGPGSGTSAFITQGRLMSRDYIKGDDAIFLLSLDDLSSLVPPKTQSCGEHCQGRQPVAQAALPAQTPQGASVATVAMAVFAVAAMLLVVAVSSMYFGRRYRRRHDGGGERGIELENRGEQ